MKHAFRRKLKRLILLLIVVFCVLFIFRLIYGYTTVPNQTSYQFDFFENEISSRRNYASKKYKVQSSNNNQSSIKVDQKYEKIAEIKTKSTNFEEEEASSRKTIEEFNALIQFEQKSGNVGYRKLNFVIGVPPENFDKLYDKLVKIGEVEAKQITKKDKTNEYKELNAKKLSLEKIRASLVDLKSKSGKIEEYMGLENRILEIDQELQRLGVSLGDFDDENEFCTVQFSLLEGKVVKIGILQRVKVALEWTIKTYLNIIIILTFILFFAFLALLAVEKLKILEKILKRD